MHPLFAEFYRTASLEPRSDELPKRWAAVEKLAPTLNKQQTIASVGWFLGTRPDDDLLKVLNEAFQGADPTFRVVNNDIELRVLTGAILGQLFATNPATGTAVIAGLAVVNGSLARQQVLSPDVVRLGEEFLFNEGVRLRQFGQVPEMKRTGLKGDQVSSELKGSPAVSSLPNFADAIGAPFQRLADTLNGLVKSTIDAVDELDNRSRVAREEGNILWWLVGGRSRTRKVPFSELAPAVATTVAGKELADLTVILPGPVGAEAVLERVLEHSTKAAKEISLSEVVQSLDEKSKGDLLDGYEDSLAAVSPILASLNVSLSRERWADSLKDNLGIDVTTLAFSASHLAKQVFSERLLARAYAGRQ